MVIHKSVINLFCLRVRTHGTYRDPLYFEIYGGYSADLCFENSESISQNREYSYVRQKNLLRVFMCRKQKQYYIPISNWEKELVASESPLVTMIPTEDKIGLGEDMNEEILQEI